MKIIFFILLLIMSSTAKSNEGLMWYNNYAYFATAQEACANDHVFDPHPSPPYSSYTSPDARRVSHNGSEVRHWRWCYGTGPNGTEHFVEIIEGRTCVEYPKDDSRYFVCKDDEPDKDDGDGCGVGNPCNPSTGNKYQSETDFSGNGLSLIRAYNSRNPAKLGFGKGWRSNFHKAIYDTIISGSTLFNIVVASETGRGELWEKENGVWQGDVDSDLLLTENDSGLRLTKKDGSFENFSSSGQITSEADINGYQTLYNYDVENQLQSVTNHYGQSISFTYVDFKITTVTDTQGAIFRYEYDNDDNLTSVIYPDTTPTDNTDNPRKTYHYENVDYPNHLTGITDENGDRYASYAYDADGKAITTEHAPTTNSVGQEKIELDYQGAN